MPEIRINYRLNGQAQSSDRQITLHEICRQLGLGDRGGYAVETNGVIVPRSQLTTTLVQPGDVIEIVHMVGGG